MVITFKQTKIDLFANRLKLEIYAVLVIEFTFFCFIFRVEFLLSADTEG